VPNSLEIYVEPNEVPPDRVARAKEIRGQSPTEPAEIVRRGLALFNLDNRGDLHAPLRLFLRDPEGSEIHGGLLGRTGRGALQIEILWIAEPYWRVGYGSRLLARAEEEAGRRGCLIAQVDTYSFQSPGFYQRNGYSEFGRVEGLSNGDSRLYYSKALADKLKPGAV
jgi:GNAT superfamily N-acetyltransferase